MVLYLLSLLGVAVSAISGSLAAGRKRLDWIGVLVLAVVTSLGGGSIRDILLNRRVFWIDQPENLWMALGAGFFTIAAVRFVHPRAKALLVADALGLALFSIVGAQIAQAESVPVLVVIIMGILTGVAGGVLRDLLTREIPILFDPKEPLYSVAALGGILVYLGVESFGIARPFAMLAGVTVCTAIRFAAIFWRISLPEFRVEEPANHS